MAKTSSSWQKGKSGNPKGRPVGTGRVDEYRALLDPHVPALLTILVEKATGGDLWAIRMILDRVYPMRDAAMADIIADIDELRKIIAERKAPDAESEVASLLQEIEALRKQLSRGAMQ